MLRIVERTAQLLDVRFMFSFGIFYDILRRLKTRRHLFQNISV
jgi:hypothetical protein